MSDTNVDFLPGQRCISNADLQLGLGTVLTVEPRTLTVVFLASGETRTYAKQSAPLTRVEFVVGDKIRSHQGTEIKVTQVTESDGLLVYTGTTDGAETISLPESELDNFLQLNRPSERLFNGQIDQNKWFELRYQTLEHRNILSQSGLYGLTGCRTSLIPHQLYIAHEVANRFSPRVLLADEVGLGKTIEAGMILHHQLLTERAHRVLIVVPETLLHQWLVEMLRRFNLHFRIFNQERCQDIIEEGNFENIFHSEQLVLCSLDFLVDNEDIYKQCLEAQWDLMVVDEAHHLQWSPQQSSKEYCVIEQLAAQTRGVLLLTATPEQLGKESHFARLRLLDPDRFPDFERFLEEEKNYEPVAQVVQDLLDGQTLTTEDIDLLRSTISEGDNQQALDCIAENSLKSDPDEQQLSNARQKLVEHMLDRHGTGRVLFRNTRAAVKGFPGRQLLTSLLPECIDYDSLNTDNVEQILTPEQNFQAENPASHWTDIDPRIQWLGEKLTELSPQKVLIICARADTALDLTRYLKTQTAIHATAFHEGLSIVERDRAAAFFADHETGSQVLICSEIGSEGRNFQFAHHMILFDLPVNPDLLEQRIGRLDRIGQSETIKIHLPIIKGSAQERLYHWYHYALNAFEDTCPAGHAIFEQVETTLMAYLLGKKCDERALIEDSRQRYQQLTDEMQHGRDRLLEYNSCRPDIAETLKEKALQQDAQQDIDQYMENVYDCFGIDTELHSDGCFIITPTEHMINRFPGLADDGMTITYRRDIALSFEDAHYITWEHPLCRNAIDMVLSNENGNSTVTVIKYSAVKAGSVLLECLFSLEVPPVEALQSHRYLPPTMIRVVCDERGVDHQAKLSHHSINAVCQQLDKGIAGKVVNAKNKILKAMLERSEYYAKQKSTQVIQQALNDSSKTLSREIDRLKALARINPNIRQEEIVFFEQQLASLNRVLGAANLRLDALRVVVVT